MKNTALVAAIACLSAFACSAAKATLYEFTTLDFPGAPLTVARGINDAGTIVGNTSQSQQGSLDTTNQGGFVLSGGNYTALSVPPGTPAALGPLSANGINNSGDITGAYQSTQQPLVPFPSTAYILSGNTLTPVLGSPTGPSFGFGINNAETSTVVARGFSASTSELAFTFSNGVLQLLVPGPPLTPVPLSETAAYGINDSNHVVGSIIFPPFQPPPGSGFACVAHISTAVFELCDDVTVIAFPEAGSTTVPHGINNAGDIVGTYSLNGVSHGFIDIGGMFQTLDDPAATGGTIAWGINNLDQVVGEYNDATGTHGFLATPIAAVSEPASALLLGMALAGLAAVRRRRA